MMVLLLASSARSGALASASPGRASCSLSVNTSCSSAPPSAQHSEHSPAATPQPYSSRGCRSSDCRNSSARPRAAAVMCVAVRTAAVEVKLCSENYWDWMKAGAWLSAVCCEASHNTGIAFSQSPLALT